MVLSFKRPLVNRTKTTRLVIHHSASGDVSAQTIHQWHLNQGYNGIGYHYLIRKNGALEKGRPKTAVGAHTKNYNHDSIGICLTGNFMHEHPTPAQLMTLKGLTQKLMQTYGQLHVYLHRELNATACPGLNFTRALLEPVAAPDPTNDFKLSLMRFAQARGWTNQLHAPDEPASKAFIIAVLKNLYNQNLLS